jgi:hypothetical protein
MGRQTDRAGRQTGQADRAGRQGRQTGKTDRQAGRQAGGRQAGEAGRISPCFCAFTVGNCHRDMCDR